MSSEFGDPPASGCVDLIGPSVHLCPFHHNNGPFSRPMSLMIQTRDEGI